MDIIKRRVVKTINMPDDYEMVVNLYGDILRQMNKQGVTMLILNFKAPMLVVLEYIDYVSCEYLYDVVDMQLTPAGVTCILRKEGT